MADRRVREALADVNLLELAPVACAEWREADGGQVVVERPRPASFWRSPVEWFTAGLAAKRIRLDRFGSFAWCRFDGKKTVAEIAREMREEFGDEVEPIEERLGLLIRMLRRERLLAYPGWDEIPAPPTDLGGTL